MKVQALDSKLEPIFWQHVNQDIRDYYFFIYYMEHAREFTEIQMVLSDENCIEGMMAIHRNSTVQLRGTFNTAKALICKLKLEKAIIQGPPEHKALILDKYRAIQKVSEIILMTLKKGEEHLQIKHPIVRLSTSDAEDVATMMRRGNPDWWGETTTEQITAGIERNLWLGVKVDGRLGSIGVATVDDWAANIGAVVTDEQYRNRGYATSIVSALVEQILQRSNLCLIHVESDNAPAARVYTKVGFKPYKTYFYAKVES